MNSPKKPEISVVMSVFGYRDYVRASVESILGQSFTDFEFIVIDDGCSYDLENMLKSFNDGRIIFVKNERNLGLTPSLIKGVEMSRGRYIARMDAGNISLVERLEKQHDFLEAKGEYYLIGTSITLVDEDEHIICNMMAGTDTGVIREKIIRDNCLNHSTIMFRNDGLVNYREKFKYSQDYDLYLNLLFRGILFGNIRDLLLKERLLPGSITYSRQHQQGFYKDLALRFYRERSRSGTDSYEDWEPVPADRLQPDNREENRLFYSRQKIYYLFYSGRLRRARSDARKMLKDRFDIKLFLYYFLSFIPLAANLLKKVKRLDFR